MAMLKMVVAEMVSGKNFVYLHTADPHYGWQASSWIRIRIVVADPDPGGKKRQKDDGCLKLKLSWKSKVPTDFKYNKILNKVDLNPDLT